MEAQATQNAAKRLQDPIQGRQSCRPLTPPLRATHASGGDLLATERSNWDAETHHESLFDWKMVSKSFAGPKGRARRIRTTTAKHPGVPAMSAIRRPSLAALAPAAHPWSTRDDAGRRGACLATFADVLGRARRRLLEGGSKVFDACARHFAYVTSLDDGSEPDDAAQVLIVVDHLYGSECVLLTRRS